MSLSFEQLNSHLLVRIQRNELRKNYHIAFCLTLKTWNFYTHCQALSPKGTDIQMI